MSKLFCHVGFFFQVSRFNHQRVSSAHLLQKPFRLANITDHNQTCAGLFRPQHLIRLYHAPVGQSDSLARHQVLSPGPGVYAERFRFFRQKRPAREFIEAKTQRSRTAVFHLKSPQRKIFGFKNEPRADIQQINRHRGLRPA